MKFWIAAVAAGMIFSAAPALAQDAGQPGAAGEMGSTTGHNAPGTAGITSAHMGHMFRHRHHHWRHHYRRRRHMM